AINRQVHDLAPVLNSPDVANVAGVTSSRPEIPIDLGVKRQGGRTYVFAVAMRDGETTGSFSLAGTGRARVEVLGEGRTIDAAGGRWEDQFRGYQVHLYRIDPQP